MAKKETKKKLAVVLKFPKRKTAADVLTYVRKNFKVKEEDTDILVIICGNFGMAVCSNDLKSSDKIWMLEHAKLQTLAYDRTDYDPEPPSPTSA